MHEHDLGQEDRETLMQQLMNLQNDVNRLKASSGICPKTRLRIDECACSRPEDHRARQNEALQKLHRLETQLAVLKARLQPPPATLKLKAS